MVNTLPAPTHEEKQAQLEKILESHVFHGAEILKSFLRFVVGKSLEGLESEVKEFTIASEVFGRNENYDPRTDSLVRVQAARLRSRLEEYYSSEGKSDPVHIDLPKGHYIPAFRYPLLEQGGEQHNPEQVPPAMTSQLAEDLVAERRRRRWSTVGIAALVVSMVAFIFSYRFYTEAKRFGENVSTNRVDPTFARAVAPLWGEMLNPDVPVLVAYSNSVFKGNAVDGLKYWIPLDSSTTLRPMQVTRALEASTITDVYTGVGEVMGVYFLGNLFWKVGSHFRVERSLLLTWEDLKAQNIVFLGGPAENLLLRRLPQEQDFVFRSVEAGSPQSVIVNRNPRAGEQETYSASADGPSHSMVTEDYAVISMLRSIEPNRRLLILAGITTFGTQACAEYVTRSDSVKDLIQRLNTANSPSQPQLPSSFQVLLKVKVNSGVPVATSYVTHHILN